MRPNTNVIEIPLDWLVVDELNVRRDLEDGQHDSDISDLAASIRNHGLLQPITVRRTGPESYAVIAGQRRFLAYNQLEMAAIPSIVREAHDESERTTLSLIENVHRADMNPMDKTRALVALRDRGNDSISDLSSMTNLNQSTVRKYLNLENLNPDLQTQLESGDVRAIGTFSELARKWSESPEDQMRVWNRIYEFRSDQQSGIIRRTDVDLVNLEEEIEFTIAAVHDLRLVGPGEIVVPILLFESLVRTCPDDQLRGIAENYLTSGAFDESDLRR